MIKKLQNKKGFTLAELLIVVAIIAVLVAISVPIFSTQLEKSRDAVSIANIRSAYAEASANYMTLNAVLVPDQKQQFVRNVSLKGTQSGWSGLDSELPFDYTSITNWDELGGTKGTYSLTFTFDYDTGSCELTAISQES